MKVERSKYEKGRRPEEAYCRVEAASVSYA
jgi:hypothetical protein